MKASQLKIIAGQIEGLRQAADGLASIQDDLQGAYDEKSDRWQEGGRGEAAMEEITTLEEVASMLEEAISLLEGLQ